MRQASGAATLLALLASSSEAAAFAPPPPGIGLTQSSVAEASSRRSRGRGTRLRNTGGWGIGPQRDLTPEEFAKGGDRRAFEGYRLRDRGEFMRSLAQEKQDLQQGEIDELLAVAQQAGIRVKDPAERLNKFELDDDEDDLDLSVQWDENDDADGQEAPSANKQKNDDSITRLDEDTGASGVW